PEKDLTERLAGRLTCPKCGRTFHPKFNPPPEPGICPFDGTPLVQRPDDNEETARTRVAVYLRDTMPVIDYYRQKGLVSEVNALLVGACRPGVKTAEIDKLADRRIREAGGRPGFLGYNGFPKSICISINDEAVHGIPGPRKIQDGDLVSLDLGLVIDGFWADMGVTVPVGEVSAENMRLVRVTEEAFWKAIEQCLPGNRLGDVSSAVQQHVEAAGFNVIRQFVGHGIGRNMHEDPQ